MAWAGIDKSKCDHDSSTSNFPLCSLSGVRVRVGEQPAAAARGLGGAVAQVRVQPAATATGGGGWMRARGFLCRGCGGSYGLTPSSVWVGAIGPRAGHGQSHRGSKGCRGRHIIGSGLDAGRSAPSGPLESPSSRRPSPANSAAAAAARRRSGHWLLYGGRESTAGRLGNDSLLISITAIVVIYIFCLYDLHNIVIVCCS